MQDNNTALSWAAYDGHKGIVDILLSAGANPDIQNKVADHVPPYANVFFDSCLATKVFVGKLPAWSRLSPIMKGGQLPMNQLRVINWGALDCIMCIL